MSGEVLKFTMVTGAPGAPNHHTQFSATVPQVVPGNKLRRISVTVPVPADFPDGKVPQLVKLELQKKDKTVKAMKAMKAM